MTVNDQYLGEAGYVFFEVYQQLGSGLRKGISELPKLSKHCSFALETVSVRFVKFSGQS